MSQSPPDYSLARSLLLQIMALLPRLPSGAFADEVVKELKIGTTKKPMHQYHQKGRISLLRYLLTYQILITSACFSSFMIFTFSMLQYYDVFVNHFFTFHNYLFRMGIHRFSITGHPLKTYTTRRTHRNFLCKRAGDKCLIIVRRNTLQFHILVVTDGDALKARIRYIIKMFISLRT